MNEKEHLERLSGIMKGLLKYKEDQELLKELILKYKAETIKIVGDNIITDRIYYSCFSAQG